MERDTLIINTDCFCLICFKEIYGEERVQMKYFPIHKVTRKLNLDLGKVFPDVVSCLNEETSQLLSKLRLFCELCTKCTDICEELKSKRPMPNEYLKLLLDKMTEVDLVEKYQSWVKPLSLAHFGIVHRLRKEMIAEMKKQHEEFKGRCIAIRTALEMMKEDPFKNDIVIRNILSFMEIKDVKMCRLINKQWNSNSCRILKRNAGRCLNLTTESSQLKRLELLSLLENGSQLPLPIEIKIDDVFLKLVESDGNLLRFLNAVSPKLIGLEVGISHQSWEAPVEADINYPVGVRFSCLKSVHFLLDRKLYQFSHFEFFRGIILNSPTLTEIQLSTHTTMRPLVFQFLLDLLREKQVKSRITSLMLNQQEDAPSTAQYDQLAELGLKLKKTRAYSITFNHDGVSHFIKSQSESLEELEISLRSDLFEIGRMERLKVLKISTHKQWPLRSFLQNISCKSLFPVLEHLQLDLQVKEIHPYAHLTIFHLSRIEGGISDTLKRLTLKAMESTPQMIDIAASLFPNLASLEIPATFEILQMVYARMQKLQELTLCYGSGWIKNVNKIDNILIGVTPKQNDDVDFIPDKSLFALTELRTLRIKSSQPFILGEKACRSVLMKMKSLKLFKFCNEDGQFTERRSSIDISNSLLDEMKKKIVLAGFQSIIDCF